MKRLILISILGLLSACTAKNSDSIKESDLLARPASNQSINTNEQPNSAEQLAKIISGEEQPPSPDEYQGQLEQAADNWFFGYGFGQTALNVGITVFYPPYALYLLTNAGLQVAGYQGVYPTDILPDETKESVSRGYSEVVSVPGRLNAAVFREDFKE